MSFSVTEQEQEEEDECRMYVGRILGCNDEMVRMRKKRNDENEKKSDDKNDLRKIFAATSPLSPPARSLTSGAHQ